MKTHKSVVVRNSVDEWSVYSRVSPVDCIGSVLRFSASQYQVWVAGKAPAMASYLNQWFPTRAAAVKALYAATVAS